MIVINSDESECMSCWTVVNKRIRAFFTKQLPRDTKLILRLKEDNNAQELIDPNNVLMTARFNNKLASFIPSGDFSLGKLVFTTIKLPFKRLGITNTHLKPIYIWEEYDFVVPLENDQLIVTIKSHKNECVTQMSCFNRLGRLICTEQLECRVKRENVTQSGPNHLVICHESDTFKLSVYNSSLHCLRSVECNEFSNICCNSKFLFGLWDTDYSFDFVEYSSRRIQVRQLDTLSEEFCLVAPMKYTMERIMADEHHVVAMSRLGSEPESRQWYMSIFDLTTCNQSDNMQQAKQARQNFALGKHVLLDLGPCFSIDSVYLSKVFLFDGWLVVPREHEDELVWFDKNGTRSETKTMIDNKKMTDFYASGSIIILTSNDGKFFFQR